MEEVDKKRKKDEEEPVPDVSGGVVAPPVEVWEPDYPVGPTCPPFDSIVSKHLAN